MGIIIIDSSEPENVKKAFKARLGNQCMIKQLGCFDCNRNYILMKKNQIEYCANKNEILLLEKSGFNLSHEKNKCKNCKKRKYVRFADFSNDIGSFHIERKSVSDLLISFTTSIDLFISHLFENKNNELKKYVNTQITKTRNTCIRNYR